MPVNENLNQIRLEIIESILMVMNFRDTYTVKHQRIVANISKRIAENLLLDQEVIHGAFLSGLSHDFGKLFIPKDLLVKSEKLSNCEYSHIKEHAQQGYQFLKGIQVMQPIAEVVLQHHERNDGSGYPFGLKEDQICIEAKIIGVVDTLSSIALDRPYRDSLGIEKALDVLKADAGLKFDNLIVDEVLNLHARNELLELLLIE